MFHCLHNYFTLPYITFRGGTEFLQIDAFDFRRGCFFEGSLNQRVTYSKTGKDKKKQSTSRIFEEKFQKNREVFNVFMQDNQELKKSVIPLCLFERLLDRG